MTESKVIAYLLLGAFLYNALHKPFVFIMFHLHTHYVSRWWNSQNIAIINIRNDLPSLPLLFLFLMIQNHKKKPKTEEGFELLKAKKEY